MPILDVELIDDGAPIDANLAANIAGEIETALPEYLGRVWVKIHVLPTTRYGESGGIPKDTAPVFIKMMIADLPPHEVLKTQAVTLAALVARVCGRKQENVHIEFTAGRGRMAFGGVLVE